MDDMVYEINSLDQQQAAEYIHDLITMHYTASTDVSSLAQHFDLKFFTMLRFAWTRSLLAAALIGYARNFHVQPPETWISVYTRGGMV